MMKQPKSMISLIFLSFALLALVCVGEWVTSKPANAQQMPSTAIPSTAQENGLSVPPVFAARNSASNTSQIGRELLARTYLGAWDLQEFNRPGKWEELKQVRAHIDQNDDAGALDLFKIYTLDKLRNIESEGLPRGRFDPFATGTTNVQWIRPLLDARQKNGVIKQAQSILGGTINVSGQDLKIGAPGSVDWKGVDATANRSTTGWPWDLEPFYPLLGAYIFTGDEKFMAGWAEYADDWALNQHAGPGATNIADMPDQWANGVETMLTFLRYLGGVANVPGGDQALPAGTFGRVMTRLLDDFVPVSILYHRSNPQNWNDASLTALPDVGFFLDEYPIGRQLLAEARRRLDLLAATHHLPDGTEMDTTVGYSNLYLVGAGTFLQRINARQSIIPDWMLTSWEKEDWRNDPGVARWEQDIHGEMLKRARTLTAHSLGSGEWPIGGTRDGHHNESQRLYNILHYFLPDAFQNPDIFNIMALSSGRRPDGPPSFLSERLPYGGHAYIRTGWGANDPYLYLYAAPYPLSGSLSVRNNNAIGLSAFGYDLLETGENGVYDQPHTPVKVDGEDQYFQFGVPTWGHRGPMLTTSVYDSPPQWRWHVSPDFNVAEGIYAGNFGKNKPLHDVIHQRLVQYVSKAGLWIVTDRLSSPQQHDYTLDWRFGIKPGDDRDFTPEQITVQSNRQSIRTVRPGGANISLYQFSSSPLRMSTAEERTPPQGYRLHDFLRVSNSWKSAGESIVVTVIFPRENEAAELTHIKPLAARGVQGFEAVTPSGATVLYQAAIVRPGVLKVSGLEASGESLLVTQNQGVPRHGVALGCRSLFLNGKPIQTPGADFEFEIIGGVFRTIPIYKPLQPVRIAPPDTTAFLGKQVVQLTSATPGCEIRYTLDGSEPTPASALYTRPITLTQSTTVKARALRPGLKALPTTLSGTTASIVTEAVYNAATPAKAVTASATLPGLHYQYYAGRWQDLLCGLSRLTPLKSGLVSKLFDTTARDTAPTYAFTYTGYFEAPADGVYNFYAPPEYYEPNIMAGYELRVTLDGKPWSPATSRHALGVWSVALAKGKHELNVVYADLRADAAKQNSPDLKPRVWTGNAPNLQVSGPGLTKGPLPEALLSCAK